MSKTPPPLSHYFDESRKAANTHAEELKKLQAGLKEAEALAASYTDSMTPGGLESAIAAANRAYALRSLLNNSAEASLYESRAVASYCSFKADGIIESAENELAELAKVLPATKDGIFNRVIELTRRAVGMPPGERAALLMDRSNHEEAAAWLDSCTQNARAAIDHFLVSPTPENFTAVQGAIGALKHEISLTVS